MTSKTPKTKKNAVLTAEQTAETQALPATTTGKKAAKKIAAPAAELPIIEAASLDSDVPSEAQGSKKTKPEKIKVIRDSFSFPKQDYQKITVLKKACLAKGMHVKKGEILRAGLHLLSQLSIEELQLAVAQVEKVKTGRPSTTEI